MHGLISHQHRARLQPSCTLGPKTAEGKLKVDFPESLHQKGVSDLSALVSFDLWTLSHTLSFYILAHL